METVSAKTRLEDCPKCGGTGFFCLYILDDRPISNTGFQCWKCGGTGKIAKTQRRKRCPRCGLKFPPDQLDYHTVNHYYDHSNHVEICKEA